jgi:DNA primase
MNNSCIANEIKQRLNTRDVLTAYGIETNSKGFACCPFHNEKTASFKVYDGDRGYYCFGCGESGDVITFVQKLFNLSFPEALRKIDTDFGLNIYGDHTFEDIRRSHYQQMAVKAKKERAKREKEALNNEYWKAFDEWKRLDDNRRIYKPKSPDEDLHPLFVESLQKLEYQIFILRYLLSSGRRCGIPGRKAPHRAYPAFLRRDR